MDEGQTETLKGIKELRAKATEQLSGNEYYMVVQQLDTLENSPELGGDLAQAFIGLIRSRLEAGSLTGAVPFAREKSAKDDASTSASSAAGSGDPEIPEPAETPAEPETPGSPEAPSIPDSPAQPDTSPAPEIPSPPSSPAQPATPPETLGSGEAPKEQEQLITPRANSFGTPQATGAINLTQAETLDTEAPDRPDQIVSEDLLSPVQPEPGTAKMPDVPPQSVLSIAAGDVRRHVAQHLHGNDYYMASNLLDRLRDLPQSESTGETVFPTSDLDAALALLRKQVRSLTGSVRDEAEALMESLNDIIQSKTQPEQGAEAETKAAIAVEAASSSEADSSSKTEEAGIVTAEGTSQVESEPLAAEQGAAEEPAPPQINLSDAPDPVPDPGPRTGFDDLADAAWHRVKDVDEADRIPPPGLNGGTAPESVVAAANLAEQAAPKTDVETQETVETAIASAPTPEPVPEEPMSEEKAEAFKDGGSERRSSGSNAAGTEPQDTGLAASASHEPAGETQIEALSAAQGETAQPSETEAIAEPETAQESGTTEMTSDDLEVEKIGPVGTTESSLQDDIRDRESRQQNDPMMDAPPQKLVDKMEEAIEEAAETITSGAEASKEANGPETAADSSALEPESTAAEKTQTETKERPAQSTKGGF